MKILNNSTLFFSANWEIYKEREIFQNGEITIFYDPYRMEDIYKSENKDVRSGMVYLIYTFDNAGIIEVPLFKQKRDNNGAVRNLSSLAATVEVPANSKEIKLWFRATKIGYKDSYDSCFGRDFTYSITKQ